MTPMPSDTFISLEAEVGNLAVQFLDFEKNPIADYSKSELTKTAAYTILAHSEIEAYFESVVGDLISAAEQLWKTEDRACKTLVCMCGFVDRVPLPEQRPSKDIWQEPIYKAIARARGLISSNNGIRPQKIIPLLAQVGFDVRSLEDDLLNQLDALGTMRGSHAHNSSSRHLGQVFDPFDRKRKIEELLRLLKSFDEAFATFRASQFDANFVSAPAKRSFIRKLADLFAN